LTRVAPDRIEFLNNGRLEYAEVGGEQGLSIFGPPTSAATVATAAPPTTEKKEAGPLVKLEGAGKFTIDQKEIDNALSNLDRLYTEIRAVPNFVDGKVSGMKILSVKGGSLFSKLGLQRGDVLQRINGVDLDVRKGFEIFNQLKDQKSLTVDLVRGGSQQTFEYEIR
jgi:general secretion pathway protein C